MLIQESKRTKSAKYVNKFVDLFSCPICGQAMQVENLQSLCCSNNHSFDFAKQGYINLNIQQTKSKYNKQLFEARRNFIYQTKFFEPMIQTIVQKVSEYTQTKNDPLYILDSGCGEGSHLTNICHSVQSTTEKTLVGVGIDIAKDGLLVAAKNYESKIWIVGDLAEAPFKDKSFHIILNILSPANYREFKRLLKDGGIVIKVVPQSDYLKELREYVFDDLHKKKYSNENTVARFYEEYTFIDHSRLTYCVTLKKEFLPSFIEMTPLTWNVSKEKLTNFLQNEAVKMTVDFDILIGKFE